MITISAYQQAEKNYSAQNPLKLATLFLIIACMLFCAPSLAGQNRSSNVPLTINVNGNISTFTGSNLEQNNSRVVVINPNSNLPEPRFGTTLGTLLPLMLDMWEFTAKDVFGRTYNLYRPDCADDLFEIFIAENRQSEGWTLQYAGTVIDQITEISIKGDLMPQKALEVWVSWEGTDQLKEIIYQYAHTFGLDITVNNIPNTSTKLMANNRGNMKVPDVVMVKSDYLPQLLSEQAIQPPGWTPSAVFQPQGIDSFTTDSLNAIPFYNDVQIICYNPEIIADIYGNGGRGSGTLEELEASLTVVGEKFIPATWNVYSAYWLAPFQMGFGKTSLLEDDNSFVINDQPTIDAVEYIIDMIDKGLLSAVERDGMIAGFMQGSIGMILTGSYSLPAFEDLGIPYEVAAYPLNQETGQYVSPMIDYKGFAIPRKSRNPVGARRLIQYLSSQPVQALFVFNNFKNPVRDDIWELSNIPAQVSDVLRVSIEQGTIIPPQPAYPIAKDTLWKILRLMLSGQLPVTEGLTSAQKIIDNQLQRLCRNDILGR